MPALVSYPSSFAAFLAGIRSALTSVFVLVLSATYVGIGALAHDFGFSSLWVALSTMFVWAAPAQVILLSSLGAGAPLFEAAIGVTLSAIRLFPMVVALLPQLRRTGTRTRDLLLPTHFTSVSMWVESLRLVPGIEPQYRIPFCNGLSVGYMGTGVVFGYIGYYAAAGLPTLLAATLLFMTPMSFLISTANGARTLVDRLAFIFGFIIGPVLVLWKIELDLMWTGVVGGTLAYAVARVRRRNA